MALLYLFTSLLLLLLLFLVVPLSQAASKSPLLPGSLPTILTLPLLQGLQMWAPGCSCSLGTNTIRLVQASSHRGQPWAGRWYVQPLTCCLEDQPEAEHLLRATVVYPPSLSLAHGCLLCALELVAASKALGVLLSPATCSHHGWTEVHVTPYLVLGNSSMGSLALRHVCVHAGRAGHHNALVAPNHPLLLLYLNDTQAGLAPLAAERHQHWCDTGTLAHDRPNYLREQGEEKSDSSLCPFPVSFAQLGWDRWIITPHCYNTRYCKGACPHLLCYDYHAPNRAVVQSFVHQLVDANVPWPSCVPYCYSPISVLVIERNGDILYKEYENMIAESCTCR